jgi:PAS domain S-box-containing protein
MPAQRIPGRSIRPAVLVGLAVALALLLAAYTIVALRQSRRALERSGRRSAEAMAESLALAIRNVTSAGLALDELWLARWHDAAEQIAALPKVSGIPATWLYDFGASRIDFSDFEGHIVASTDPGAGVALPVSLLVDSSWTAIREGALYAEFDRRHTSGAAMLRTDRGALILWGATERLSRVQRDVGAGHLLRSISELPGLEYVVLQSRDGIEMASRRVEQMTRIEDDSLLSELLSSGRVVSREWVFNDDPVIEASARIPAQERILRVGVARRSLQQLDRSITIQLTLLGGLIFLLGLGGLAVFWSSQRYSLLAEDLNAAEALTDELFRGIRAALLVIDGKGFIRLANPPAGHLLGQPASALVGQPYVAVAPGDPARLRPLLERGEAALEQEVTWTDREGQERVLLVSASRLRGELTDAVAIMHDVTETRRLAMQAEQNERLAAVGDLAAGVAHEIRNPLNAISIAAQRLKAEFRPTEQPEEFSALLTHLRGEIARVNDTVQQFLGLARGVKLERGPVDLSELVTRVAATLQMEAEQKGVTLTAECPNMPPVQGDREALHKVVQNLGQNALHATPRGGTITLRTQSGARDVALSVVDTGSGIDPGDLPHLFRPYFSKKQGGSGIGLALVHRIVTAHGGTVTVNSKPGAGSTFTVRLPRDATAQSPDAKIRSDTEP